MLGLCIAWVAVLAFFHTFPTADTTFAALFCRAEIASPDTCALFPVRGSQITRIVRSAFYWIPIVSCLLLAADIAWQFFRNRWRDRGRLHDEMLAIAAYFLGPLLIVNGWLKAYSGRPRPDDTTLFGGSLDFVSAGDFSGACLSNCSFVSGEAAAAGWLLCLVPMARSRLGRLPALLIVGVSVATPFLRVAMGGHFLSDAVLGWLIGAASFPALSLLARPLLRRRTATLDRPR